MALGTLALLAGACQTQASWLEDGGQEARAGEQQEQAEVPPEPEQPVNGKLGRTAGEPKADLRAAVGVFALAPGGKDITLGYRPGGSHWLAGLRYVGWVDIFSDPYTGNDLTQTESTLAGAFVDYLFDRESGAGWYVGVEVLRWAKSEHSLITGETGSDEVVAPFIGGGFLWSFGEHFYSDLGLFLAPGAKVSTSTSVSSDDDSGGFDVRLQLGIRF
jgi:hypothetical protein